MQIYFHSRLCSYLSRVPILVEDTVYVYVYIYTVYIYIYLICIYLYFYILLLVLSECIKGLRVTQFQFSVCMYGTCGRIDNKADFDFDFENRVSTLLFFPQQ